MNRIIAAVRDHATRLPLQIALEDENGALRYSELIAAVEHLAHRLQQFSPRVIGILADNGRAWVLTDLAAQLAGIPVVPLPAFFSSAQITHVIRTAAIDLVFTDQPGRISTVLQQDLPASPFHDDLFAVRVPVAAATNIPLPSGTWKVTFTSGTTGEPKGVCLGIKQLETTAESLRAASVASSNDRHLCLLPLATLLENIGGIYVPLLAGATICVPPLASVGLSGSSGLDTGRLITALNQWQATSAIVVPQILRALVAAGDAGAALPLKLRYLAVGGAPVALRLLHEAEVLGLPVYEGYGLSECASVVAVNRPHGRRPGSVGKPLPHVRIDFAEDGEVLIHGIPWRGYLGEQTNSRSDNIIATGDLGFLDEDGFLHITGRKKNIFITSFGRNVAPEWVESELTSRHPILQAAIFGDGRPFNAAVIVPHPTATPHSVTAALDRVNEHLPDYARVRAWIPAREPFTLRNGMSTPNGRLRRSSIFSAYADQIDALYQH